MATRNQFVNPSSGQFAAPTGAPDMYARQLRAMQQLQSGQRMMERADEPLQGQMVSGHYVAPHWTQYVGQALGRYAGDKSMADAIREHQSIQQEQQAQTMAQFGFGPSELAQGLGGPGAPAGAGPQPVAQGAMVLPGLTPEQSMLALQTLGPEKYMAAYAKQFEPTNEQRNLAHLPPEMRQKILTSQAAGQAMQDGTQIIMGADGQMYSVPVHGYAESQAALAGGIASAQETAKAERDLVEVPTGSGGTQMMSRENAVKQLQGVREEGAGSSKPGFTPPPLSDTKERRDFEKEVRADIAAGERTIRLVDRNIAYIDRLLENEDGLRGITGQLAQFKPTMIMLDGELDANSDIDTIKSKVVLQTMEEMRKSSAAGATGFGNMNREQLKVIQDALGSLERAQTGDQIIENLRVIRNAFDMMRNDAVRDFDSDIERYGQYAGDGFKAGDFGTKRETKEPSEITSGRTRQQQLDEILGL